MRPVVAIDAGVVYTLPSKLRDIAYQNKRVVYDLLMKAAAETTLAIAADQKRLGARIGITAVLHTWGSALTHHPHVHMIVPGGGLSFDGTRWVSSRSNFLVHVNVTRTKMAPAIGALNAVARPAPAPAASSTLQSGQPRRNSLPTRCPMVAAIWTVGPSRPSASPEPIASTPPTNFTGMMRRCGERTARFSKAWRRLNVARLARGSATCAAAPIACASKTS